MYLKTPFRLQSSKKLKATITRKANVTDGGSKGGKQRI